MCSLPDPLHKNTFIEEKTHIPQKNHLHYLNYNNKYKNKK